MIEYVSTPGSIIGALQCVGGALFLYYGYKKNKYAQERFNEARTVLESAKKESEQEKKDSHQRLKNEFHKKRNDFELEIKKERLDMERLESKLQNRDELLVKKEQRIEIITQELQQKEREISRTSDRLHSQETKSKNIFRELMQKLETTSGINQEQARQMLFDMLRAETHLSNEKWLQKSEEEARSCAKERANQLIVTALQRYSSEQVAIHSTSTVQLPNEEMKGRIIGKEGRNIKSLEMATGMEFLIGDTPEIITISGFHPIRREIARRSLERLIADGRINPTRIEETVAQCQEELDENIQEYGRQVIVEFNLRGIHPDIVTLLGKLHFRTSFSQNVLQHSKEVGIFARMVAEELGLDGAIALRAGLLHDIGKAVTAEVEGPHAMVGAEIARRCGESPLIVNAIGAHHEEIVCTSLYAVIVIIADIMSASRPGARRETLSTYIKRLTRLEEIANSFEGVKKAYALQAGREVRVIVQEDCLTDDKAAILARDIAKKVEEDMVFPGQIKVNVIREKRCIEYAR